MSPLHKLEQPSLSHTPEETRHHEHTSRHCGDHTHDHEQSSSSRHVHTGSCCAKAPDESVTAEPSGHHAPPENASRARFRIDNMDCPTEERLIRNALEALPGVVRLDFNLLERELTVYHQLNDTGMLVSTLEKLDMAPCLLDTEATPSPPPSVLSGKTKGLLAIAGGAAVAAEAIGWISGQESSWPVMALTVISILSAGLPTLRKGWVALKNMTLNIYFLMTIATAGALVIGKWPEAAMVVFLFALAEAIEVLSLERVRHSIRSLTSLAPETAEARVGDNWNELPVNQVAIGSRIRVRTGARVPLDARVEAGVASLDQAPITGESLPVDKQPGDVLYAGSIAVDGVVEAVVIASAGESTLARIAAAIQEAQSQRAPTQRFIDQFARYYTPAVVGIAITVAVLGPALSGGAWSGWLYQALVMLVIACPCALVISTPVTVVSGLTAAARHGILVKGGAYLENGRLLKTMALDKTGTLTTGKPELTDVITLGPMPAEQALLIAASLDEHSTHPVAKAIVAGWRKRQPNARLLAVRDFGVINGSGVKGTINGNIWYLCNHRLAQELGAGSPVLEGRLAVLEQAAKSAITLCSGSEPMAVFGVADSVRPESAQAVAALRALHVEPVMLSGDNTTTARAIADQIGIRKARGNLTPFDKQTAISELSGRHGSAGMVGDGINDAPALARADIGFAMGAAGSATALETADVAIMDDNPRKVADFINLSRRCAWILRQNIAVAIGIKAVFLALAFGGHATLWMAVFADMGASLLVVFNGLRLLGYFGSTDPASS